jgi:hypothetical protein
MDFWEEVRRGGSILAVLGVELRALQLPGKLSTTRATLGLFLHWLCLSIYLSVYLFLVELGFELSAYTWSYSTSSPLF